MRVVRLANPKSTSVSLFQICEISEGNLCWMVMLDAEVADSSSSADDDVEPEPEGVSLLPPHFVETTMQHPRAAVRIERKVSLGREMDAWSRAVRGTNALSS